MKKLFTTDFGVTVFDDQKSITTGGRGPVFAKGLLKALCTLKGVELI